MIAGLVVQLGFERVLAGLSLQVCCQYDIALIHIQLLLGFKGEGEWLTSGEVDVGDFRITRKHRYRELCGDEDVTLRAMRIDVKAGIDAEVQFHCRRLIGGDGLAVCDEINVALFRRRLLTHVDALRVSDKSADEDDDHKETYPKKDSAKRGCFCDGSL